MSQLSVLMHTSFGQFILGGGALTALVSLLRDRAIRWDSKIAALREMNIKIDDLYRSNKQIKRLIRARVKIVLAEGADPEEPVAPNLEPQVPDKEHSQLQILDIEASYLSDRLDELSNTQLKLEQVRNAIEMRADLFSDNRKDLIRGVLRYSEGYLRSVVEEFEKRCIGWNGDERRIIPKNCPALSDYLHTRWAPPSIKILIERMRAATSTSHRYEAFKELKNAADKVNPRHKSISDECMLLAMREIRDAINARESSLIDRLVAGLSKLLPEKKKALVEEDGST
jgi:hypothetical protein